MNFKENKNIDTRLSDTLTQFGEEHDDPDQFVEGRCAELAVATCMLGDFLNLKSEVVIMLRDEICNDDGSLQGTILSHCIAEVSGVYLDIEGPDAEDKWLDKWPIDIPCEHNLLSEFRYEYHDYTSKLHDYALSNIRETCDKWSVPLDEKAIELLYKELKAILYSNRLDYQHLETEKEIEAEPAL